MAMMEGCCVTKSAPSPFCVWLNYGFKAETRDEGVSKSISMTQDYAPHSLSMILSLRVPVSKYSL